MFSAKTGRHKQSLERYRPNLNKLQTIEPNEWCYVVYFIKCKFERRRQRQPVPRTRRARRAQRVEESEVFIIGFRIESQKTDWRLKTLLRTSFPHHFTVIVYHHNPFPLLPDRLLLLCCSVFIYCLFCLEVSKTIENICVWKIYYSKRQNTTIMYFVNHLTFSRKTLIGLPYSARLLFTFPLHSIQFWFSSVVSHTEKP